MSTTDTLFSGVGRHQVSGLNPGSNPTRIHNEAKDMIRNHTSLPKKTTAREVEKLAKIAGQLKTQGVLLRDSARHKQAIVRNALGILQTRTAHSGAMQKAKVQYAQIMAKHGENIAINGSQYAQISAGYSGFDEQFRQAEAIVSID